MEPRVGRASHDTSPSVSTSTFTQFSKLSTIKQWYHSGKWTTTSGTQWKCFDLTKIWQSHSINCLEYGTLHLVSFSEYILNTSVLSHWVLKYWESEATIVSWGYHYRVFHTILQIRLVWSLLTCSLASSSVRLPMLVMLYREREGRGGELLRRCIN